MSKLKLQFEANQDFQNEAIASIVDIFEGEKVKNSKFTATARKTIYGDEVELGYANKLDLLEEELLTNVINIQDRNKLKRSKKIIDDKYGVPNFTIEMETGTGKTYVYSKTILELNRKYGYTKFIIVVPSVAIREGVKNSLEATKEHFNLLYPGLGVRSFVYSSQNLTELKNFATSSDVEIMIMNIDSFRKSLEEKDGNKRVIHNYNDKLQGRKPIEFVSQTRPIVIIDEPQSVDNTENAKESIKSLNPLFILRYSATHKQEYNLMYKLGPVDAHERGLVKSIEVLSVQDVGGSGNEAYIKLLGIKQKAGSYSAKIDIRAKKQDGVFKNEKVEINLGKKKGLYELSGENEKYKGYVLQNIVATPGKEHIEFDNGEFYMLGNDTTDLENKRAQIKFTIETHLDKEMNFLEKGIKVISLFFLDEVSNYRIYSEENDEKKIELGVYAKIFEEEYLRAINSPKYHTLFNEKFKEYALNQNVSEVHDGYFAKDKKGKLKNSSERTTSDDESAYELIMKNKERLLSLDTNLRFIFSHSALKEGWDNPNVFQICTLVETSDDITKRQKIGRGLRLPVNQSGERIRDKEINILTVLANESYEEFAEGLQKEFEQDTNTRFGEISARVFEDILIRDGDQTLPIGYEKGEQIINQLITLGYLDASKKVTLKFTEARENNTFDLGPEFNEIKKEVQDKIVNSVRRIPVYKKTSERKELNKEIFPNNEDFKNLWDRIKYKTLFRLSFKNELLVDNIVDKIKKMDSIQPNKIVAKLVDLNVTKKGIDVKDPKRYYSYVRENISDFALPNILENIEQSTRLKKTTICEILKRSGRLVEAKVNPEEFVRKIIDIIETEKRLILINSDGLKYEKLGDSEFYAQEQFDNGELMQYITSNSLKVSKSVYSHITYDSEIEREFAEKLNNDSSVKVFLKLPSWFKIDTPLGNYNPDWAAVIDKNGEEKLYFILETKGSVSVESLRLIESFKIACGIKHFAAIGTNVDFKKVSNYEDFRENI